MARMKFTTDQIERGLRNAMRSRGWLVPTTIAEVETAERIAVSDVPPSLADVSAVLEKLSSSPNERELRKPFWTHPSVVPLRALGDPIDIITARARKLVLEAIEAGWSGPPYDPFALAEIRGIKSVPTQRVVDARIVPLGGKKLEIQFNPDRPLARVRYSIAHELAHSLFQDCGLAVRNRASRQEMVVDEWQLETLCNIGAAEILMPIGSLSGSADTELTMERILALRNDFRVSSEAVLLRLARLTRNRCVVFACHKNIDRQRYQIDYAFSSQSSKTRLKPGYLLPRTSRASECTAIDFTAAGDENWISGEETWKIEYLAVPPYPGHTFPRVIGIAAPTSAVASKGPAITYLKGDATQPRGSGDRLVVQIVNDRGLTWGAGFALAARKKWPHLQSQFTEWVTSSRGEFRLGATQFVAVEPSLVVANLVAQHGYGPSPTPRLRYGALASCLDKVRAYAVANHLAVHMPRIGCGQAGGSWGIISEMITDTLCRSGLEVTVYDPPSAVGPRAPAQQSLLFA
jgi:Zn-dependent peptidase ImmA (M78 family)